MRRLLLSCSVGLNAALALVLLISQRNGPVAGRVASTPRAEPPLPGAEAARRGRESGGAALRAEENAWRAIEEGDFPAAFARLRSAGFPEPVAQDIIVGAVNRRYGPKLLALRRTSWRYWDPVQRRKLDSSSAELQGEKQAHALELERSKLFQELLGLDWPRFEACVTGRPDPLEKFTEVFSPQARPRARQILEQYEAAERAVIRAADGTVGLPERRELARLYRSKIAELSQFAAPGEVEDYELRASPAAEDLKQLLLVGFDPTEEEFRTIFRARKAFEPGLGEPASDSGDPTAPQRNWLSQSALEDALRRALGEKRYADYRRSQDYTFRGLLELTDQFDLPNEAAVQVHEMRELALRQVRALRQDARLSGPQRNEALQQIRAASEESVRAQLGDAAYSRYTQLQIGGWIDQLAQP